MTGLPPVTVHAADVQPAIGVAAMRPDGTLILDLRAEGLDGSRGDARFVYPPAHPDYAMMLAHLGGLKPGDVKPVPAFGPADSQRGR